MKKRIAVVTPTFPPYRGGIGKVAELDSRQLAALGHDVHVFTPTRGAATDPSYAVHELRAWLRYGNAAFVPGVMPLVRSFDLIILHYPFFGGAEPLAFAKPFGRAKLVLAYHMDVVGSGFFRSIFAAHAKFVMPRIVRAADRVLVTTEEYARSSKLAPPIAADPSRFRTLAPSIDLHRFSPGPKPTELLRRHGFADTDRVVVFVGGLDSAHYFKGIPVLLDAMASPALAASRAVIVGDGDLRPAFEARAAELGVANRVVFAGGVSDDALPAYYRLADLFAFPSLDRSEAFGIAALEALASGAPVVASDLPGVRTIVREGETGALVPPGDAAALAARMAAILGDDALRQRMAANARAMTEREYGDAARQEKLRDIIAALL